MPRPLNELRERLEIEDLQWIMFRNRVDKLNQAFWETQSTRFEALEQAQKDSVLLAQIDHNTQRLPPAWLVEQSERFMRYNRRWWSLQPALLKGGWLAQVRNLRWKLACWRYSILP
ncbi:hypothetical protein PTTG_25824 [Puccinia triticina 1-1 BBBD Race 1]|uniref:Uncharacterized protein n=1 Tax=Puccinia triticina (isolate 1-1 / race 1 (BBBD)) TaxID=630390 RepID=A0A180GZ80_PUCT1|nr:hypothetical protein PTTG_25824 [Puccinia triticina 1-1 BBBD Race 1]